ncbi:DUF6762 family protein [Chakrabartyella piscis]|uniref:DUF6762 family protein n=1 Tax=Chakrabartyella piscis TaxID=2918914 RepID=UPI002958D204|nr:DUF6762 family protein [Chakrabartyella piscis]
MEEQVIVLMKKDKETGFLLQELGAYTVFEAEGLVFRAYVEEIEGKNMVVLQLTSYKEIADWEYDAIFDYYDTEVFAAFDKNVEEVEGEYQPIWMLKTPFSESQVEMEEVLTEIIEIHKEELESVYEAIADKKDDYCEA